jgi:uncharacterized membrane protein YfcA
MIIILYLAVGALTGILSGLLGVGGGVVIVPAFVWIFHLIGLPFELIMHFAIAGSLAVMSVTSMMSCYAHYRRGNVQQNLVKKLLPGMVIGVLLGSSLAAIARTSLLELLFGVLLVFIALHLFFGREKTLAEGESEHFPGWVGLFLIMFLIGLCSGLLGVGGGVLIIPVLTAFGVNMHKAAATSSSLIIPVALLGALNFLIVGLHDHVAVVHATGYLYWPAIIFTMIGGIIFAPIGTALGARFKSIALRRIYAVLLFMIGLQFLL